MVAFPFRERRVMQRGGINQPAYTADEMEKVCSVPAEPSPTGTNDLAQSLLKGAAFE